MSEPAGSAAFAAIKAQLIDRTGHHYYADKDAQLRERIDQRIAATGVGTMADYLALLDHGRNGEAEWRRLESATTINETFFFRFAEQFAAIREHILPELIRRRAGGRRLRIWSAGCSTGAEAYSLAVIVHDLLGDALGEWSVSILGTDIDDAALDAARAGRFGEWALRTTSAEDRERLFIAEGRHWRICPQYQALVRLERHNLLSLAEGTGALQLSDFDLILCRNVLIYFSADRASAIVDALGERIAADGWLIIGHAEPGPTATGALVGASVGGVLAWRRREAVPESAPDLPPPPPIPPAAVRPPQRARAALSPTPPTFAPALTTAGLAGARAALASGLLDQALVAAQQARTSDPLSPTAHFLAGLALAGLDRAGEAEAAFGRALYLDPRFAMAHYLSGVLHADGGRRREAGRAYASAARALAGRTAADMVEEGEGLTVADLQGALRWRLAEAQPR